MVHNPVPPPKIKTDAKLSLKSVEPEQVLVWPTYDFRSVKYEWEEGFFSWRIQQKFIVADSIQYRAAKPRHLDHRKLADVDPTVGIGHPKRVPLWGEVREEWRDLPEVVATEVNAPQPGSLSLAERFKMMELFERSILAALPAEEQERYDALVARYREFGFVDEEVAE